MLNSVTANPKKISFVANQETMGDGINPLSMDYFLDKQYPYLSIIVPFLKERKYEIEVLDWKDPSIHWKNKTAIIFGPIWGYTKNSNDFIRWINALERDKIKTINSLEFIRWNLRKSYLLELQKININIPSTILVDSASNLSLEDALILFENQFDINDVIIKGVVDAGAFTYKHLTSKNKQECINFYEIIKSQNSGVVIQNFIPEICQKGELRFVFYGRKLSHFFVRVPCKNEERIQPFYGGRSFHINPSNIQSSIEEIKKEFRPDLILNVKEIVAAREQVKKIHSKLFSYLENIKIVPPQYLCIDGVMIDHKFTVMEIEGIEPYMEMCEGMEHDPNNNIIENYFLSVIP